MIAKKTKERLVILLNEDEFKKFKEIAVAESRTAGNLGAKIIRDFLKEHSEKLQSK